MAMDRISELPDFIIHDILSSLPKKEAARTVILSKAWLQAWQTYPRTLEFNEDLFLDELTQQGHRPGLQRTEYHEKFLKFVDESMERFVERKLRMKAFTLSVCKGSDSAKSLMKKWTELAADQLIEELRAHIKYGGIQRWFFPESVLAATSLKAFRSLKKLSLSNVKLDDISIHRLLARFPCIEDLSLYDCKGLTGLKFGGSKDIPFVVSLRIKNLILSLCRDLTELKISDPGLLSLKLSWCDKLVNPQIDAPSLQKFGFKGDLPSFTVTAPQCSLDISCDVYMFSDEWIRFLSSSMQLNELILTAKQDTLNETIFQGFRKDTLRASELWKLEHLRLCVLQSPKIYRGLIDSLLWSCRPKTLKSISVVRGPRPSNNLIMHLHSRLKRCGCSSSAAECWCHGLKAVSMTDQNGQHIKWKDLPSLFPKLGRYDSICFQLQWCQ